MFRSLNLKNANLLFFFLIKLNIILRGKFQVFQVSNRNTSKLKKFLSSRQLFPISWHKGETFLSTSFPTFRLSKFFEYNFFSKNNKQFLLSRFHKSFSLHISCIDVYNLNFLVYPTMCISTQRVSPQCAQEKERKRKEKEKEREEGGGREKRNWRKKKKLVIIWKWCRKRKPAYRNAGVLPTVQARSPTRPLKCQ